MTIYETTRMKVVDLLYEKYLLCCYKQKENKVPINNVFKKLLDLIFLMISSGTKTELGYRFLSNDFFLMFHIIEYVIKIID